MAPERELVDKIKELITTLRKLKNKQIDQLQKVLVLTRQIVPLLKDLKMNSVADQLESEIFIYDSLEGEIEKTVKNSEPKVALGALVIMASKGEFPDE